MKVRSVPIGEVCTIVGGGTPATNVTEYYGGSIPWITPKDMKTWDIHDAQITITGAGLQNSATRLVPANSVLVVVRSGVLKHSVPVAINRVPVAINQDMKALLCSEAADPNYVARFVKERSRVILQWVRATTADNFPIDKLKHLELPLPPIPEQRRIAAILDKADELRAKRRAALAKLDTLTQSIFLDMFGDPVKNDRGWPTNTVGHFVAGFETGKNLVADDEDDDSDGLRVLKVSAVTLLRFRPEESKALPPGYVPPPSHFVRKGDLLFSRANTKELIGATALVDHAWEGLVLPDKLWRFLWHEEPRADPRFVHWLFRQPKLRFELGRRATGTSGSMKNISQEKVLDIKVGLPELPLQREFARIAYAIDRLRQIGEEALSTINTVFISLQYRAFQGEL